MDDETSPANLALIKQIEAQGAKLDTLVESLRLAPGLDQHWIGIGADGLRDGIQALVRAVAQSR